jgi:hypothetical protein
MLKLGMVYGIALPTLYPQIAILSRGNRLTINMSNLNMKYVELVGELWLTYIR